MELGFVARNRSRSNLLPSFTLPDQRAPDLRRTMEVFYFHPGNKIGLLKDCVISGTWRIIALNRKRDTALLYPCLQFESFYTCNENYASVAKSELLANYKCTAASPYGTIYHGTILNTKGMNYYLRVIWDART